MRREFDLKKHLSSPDKLAHKWAVMAVRFAVVSRNCSLFTSGPAKRLEPREKSWNMTAVVWSLEGSERYATRMISPNESEQVTRDTYVSVFNTFSQNTSLIFLIQTAAIQMSIRLAEGGEGSRLQVSWCVRLRRWRRHASAMETMFSYHLHSAEEKEAVWHIIWVKTPNSVLFSTWMNLTSEMQDWFPLSCESFSLHGGRELMPSLCYF